jgi:hypothetical protein
MDGVEDVIYNMHLETIPLVFIVDIKTHNVHFTINYSTQSYRILFN